LPTPKGAQEEEVEEARREEKFLSHGDPENPSSTCTTGQKNS
jgi:hypothetical protein